MRPGSSGFSAIEALVAVAIVAVALIPLLDLQRQVLASHQRQAAQFEEASATENALVLLAAINPTTDPSGVIPMAGASLHWTATPIGEAAETSRADSASQTYLVRRYYLDVAVTSDDGIEIAAFTIEKVGWRLTGAAPRTVME